MNIALLFAFLLAIFAVAQGQSSDPLEISERQVQKFLRKNSLAKSLGLKKIEKIRSRVKRKGCNVDLCFALDGSKAVSSKDYNLQKEFVQLVSFIASAAGEAEYSAVQYGLIARPISVLTGDTKSFLDSIGKSKQDKSPKTLVGVGLGFCLRSVRQGSKKSASKIVVLGDAKSNLSDTTLQLVLDVITKEDVFAIGIGFRGRSDVLFRVAKKKSSRLFLVSKSAKLATVVEKVAKGICSL